MPGISSSTLPSGPSDARPAAAQLVLGIDTCGPAGSVALGKLQRDSGDVEVLGEIELEGRSYSATVVPAVDELLRRAGVGLRQVGCLVAVNGPGSFTGVRVGLSTVKGLAEGAGIPLAAVSRLQVLAGKAGVGSAALDAHRSELFLRLGLPGKEAVELLAGAAALAAIQTVPIQVAVCDDAAAAMAGVAWPSARLVRVAAPGAGDALKLTAKRVLEGDFADAVAIDGNYLRRSDAEIFGEPGAREPARG
jgi:tRNA threonylcarbamoyladenosine biosynthesis protein TsaB